MVINDHFRFIFIHVPKAAGSSLMHALQQLEGNNTRLLAATKHETIAEFLRNWHGRADSSTTVNPQSYTRFALVRNPWTRMHSFYRYLVEMRPRHEIDTVKSFKEFLVQSCDEASWINSLHSMRPQVDFLVNEDRMFDMDYVGHYEYLHEDIRTLGDLIGIDIQIPHLNRSSSTKDDYRKRFDNEMIEIVRQRFRDDIDQFGYVFDVARPENRCSGMLRGAS